MRFKSGGRKRLTFRYICRALDVIAQRLGYRVYFLTFTLGDDVSVQSRELDKILKFLRMRFKRAGHSFWYAWVIELQYQRYLKFGKAALHWHFAVIAPAGSLPHVRFNANAPRGYKYVVVREGSVVTALELKQFWGRGQTFCCEALGRIEKYLGKYLTKDDALLSSGEFPQFDGFRRFGSSQLGRERLPDWAKSALAKLDDDGVPVNDLLVRREGSYLSLYAYGDGVAKVRLMRLRSPWRCVGVEYA